MTHNSRSNIYNNNTKIKLAEIHKTMSLEVYQKTIQELFVMTEHDDDDDCVKTISFHSSSNIAISITCICSARRGTLTSIRTTSNR